MTTDPAPTHFALPADDQLASWQEKSDGALALVAIKADGQVVVPEAGRRYQSWLCAQFTDEAAEAYASGATSVYEVWDDAGSYGYVTRRGSTWAAHRIDDYPQFAPLLDRTFATREQAVGALVFVDRELILPLECGSDT